MSNIEFPIFGINKVLFYSVIIDKRNMVQRCSVEKVICNYF